MTISRKTYVISSISRMGSNEVYIAQYDYLPQRVDELALMKGDIVKMIEIVEEGWAKGEVK